MVKTLLQNRHFCIRFALQALLVRRICSDVLNLDITNRKIVALMHILWGLADLDIILYHVQPMTLCAFNVLPNEMQKGVLGLIIYESQVTLQFDCSSLKFDSWKPSTVSLINTILCSFNSVFICTNLQCLVWYNVILLYFVKCSILPMKNTVSGKLSRLNERYTRRK